MKAVRDLSDSSSRIETKNEVNSYLANLKYALDNGAKITFQIDRKVDSDRQIQYTNRYTMTELFPDENPQEALRQELKTLTVENYIRTLKDKKFPNKSEMREFGKVYEGHGDVYIKIRVELFSKENNGNHHTFVMSFHFAETPFEEKDFPYKN